MKTVEFSKKEIVIINGNNFPISGASYSIPSILSNGSSIAYTLTPSPTGCGLALFSGFSYFATYKLSSDEINFIKEILKKQCISYHCLIATLGDNYLSKTSTKSHYEQFLEDMGFKQIHEYENKNHGTGYKQRIYSLEVKNL